MKDTKMHVYQGNDNKSRYFHSHNPFFRTSERFTITQEDDMLIFGIVTLDTEGKTYKGGDGYGGAKRFHAFSKIPVGHYEMDEEDSNSDSIVYHIIYDN